MADLKTYRYLCVLVLLFSFVQLHAQEIPNIIYYSPEEYKGETQNWMIDKDAKGHIFVANNSGLLDYNGVSWNLYPTPNQTIMRSVKVVNDRIYTGYYMGFGYWVRNSKGTLDYFNLSDKIKNQLLEDEQIWKIHAIANKILFQSLNQIHIYDPDTEQITVIKIDGIIEKSVSLNEILYFHTIEGKIYKLENGEPLWLADVPLKGDDRIENIINTASGLKVLTKRNGFFKIENEIVTKWPVPADDFLAMNSVYTSLPLTEGRLALGLVANGLVILDENGRIAEQFSTSNGLSNNTILSLFEDQNKNLWLGLDIGINLINLETRLEKFFDPFGKLGTVYASAVFEGNLYLGTNHGLYFKKFDSDESFQLIPNTKDQVWDLFVFDNTLFCAHNFGIYEVKQNIASLIFSDYGVWTFKPNPVRKNELIAGTFKGLGSLRKDENGRWKFKKIEGFNISSRNIATDTLQNIWVSHEYKGVYQLRADDNYDNAILIPNNFENRISKNSSVVTFKNKILFADHDGVFHYDYNKKQFEKDTFYSQIIDNQAYHSGKLINIEDKELWVFNRDDIRYFKNNNITGELVKNSIHLSQSSRKTMQGYENINYLPNATYLVGNTEGYLLFPEEQFVETDFNFEIVQIRLITKNGNPILQDINGTFEADFGFQSLNFTLSDYSHNSINPIEFSYRMSGADKEWSPWIADPMLSFGFLEWGNYELEIRARKGDKVASKIISYTFSIKRPWYFSNLSLLAYVCITILMVYIIHRRYKSYYRTKQEHLLAEKQKQMDEISLINKQQIIQLKNEQLNLLVEKKNRELENVTANLIKKNELLNNLSKEIKKLPNQQNLKPLLLFIDKNRNESKDWQIFEEAFNNADKEFINKLKNKHPNLTHNDLKLCAYLRLNLSSKEIAPLLNISVRSLEIKRYRLRQKLDLPHETNLTDYILGC